VEIEYADLSVIGHRDDNQDRVAVAAGERAVMLVAVDGMGGHADGARAAETARASLVGAFWQQAHPLFDPLGFLHLGLGRAHEDVVALGHSLAPDARPRATCAVCLVQEGSAYWAHVGDSRVYQLREGTIRERTRDHSHVELLLREGLIHEHELRGHPMRNFVECCLGGDAPLPDMSVTGRKKLSSGDVLLVCTDGVWSGVDDADIAALSAHGGESLDRAVRSLAERAVARNSPYSDNTSVAAVRWLGE